MAVTPNGYADAVNEGYFVMPEERHLTVTKFLDILEAPDSAKGIFYIQKQNSNLTDEFQAIMSDIDTQPAWGTEVFGKKLLIKTCLARMSCLRVMYMVCMNAHE